MVDIAAAVPDDAPAIAAVNIRSWQAAYAGILEPGWLAAFEKSADANGAGPAC